MGVRGFNWGLDFTGGTVIEITLEKPAEIDVMRDALQKAGFEEPMLQNFGSSHDIMVRMPPAEGETGGQVCPLLLLPFSPLLSFFLFLLFLFPSLSPFLFLSSSFPPFLFLLSLIPLPFFHPVPLSCLSFLPPSPFFISPFNYPLFFPLSTPFPCRIHIRHRWR